MKQAIYDFSVGVRVVRYIEPQVSPELLAAEMRAAVVDVLTKHHLLADGMRAGWKRDVWEDGVPRESITGPCPCPVCRRQGFTP